MIKCQDVAELATNYMERALPLRDSFAVRLHLGLCGACRAYIGQLQKTIALLRNQKLGDPPAGLAERVADSAADRSQDRKADS